MAKVEEITDANAKPSAMGRLGTTDDWTITVWCDQCDVWHHYLAAKLPKGKSFDVWELETHPDIPGATSAAKKKALKKKAASKPAKDGALHYFGRFASVDVAAEKIEEALSDEDEDDDEDEDEDLDEDEDE